MIDKNASNQSGGSINTTNGIYTYGSSYGTVTKVTNITREYDKDGNLVKEHETVTEYEKPHTIYPTYPTYPPYQPTWISSSGGTQKVTN